MLGSSAAWRQRCRRPPLRAGELEIRPSEFLALVDGERLHLTVRELELLTALVERRDRIVRREELYRAVWGEPYRKSDRSVDVYVGKLRQKLEDAAPRAALHPHPLRLRLPLRRSRRARLTFTSFSQGGDSWITDCRRRRESPRRT